jgi:pimeloyl-ACP methyl ester carboxylesterase
VIPGSAVAVPDEAVERWEQIYAPAVVLALALKPAFARELIRITGAPVEREDIAAIAATAVSILRYNVIGTANAHERLGGQPFDNTERVYTGSSDDAALNAGVARFTADAAALAAMSEFETTGDLQVPVVTLHTTGDPIVPFEQQARYAEKVTGAGSTALLEQIEVERYGHCSFEAAEVLGAFSNLIGRLTQPLALRQ